MNNILNFSTDRVNVFSLLLDKSSSMSEEAQAMIDGLKLFKRSFENFSEASSMAVSVNRFNSDYQRSPFESVENFNINYSTYGTTALYGAIVKGAKQLLDYIVELNENVKADIRPTFILLSDGKPCGDDQYDFSDARRAITALNNNRVTTVFVAFGTDIDSSFGERLGFKSTLDVKDRSTLMEFMGVELSKSCKEQSKSMKALGSNFFSKAEKSKSDKYSQKTKQVLDDDWYNDI